jgi:Zn-finger nucleic acid-binding protein
MEAACRRGDERLSFELKYCERCGGLWLRPMGGGQIYCRACGLAIAELPPSSYEAEIASVEEESVWGDEDAQADDESESLDEEGVDSEGGVA